MPVSDRERAFKSLEELRGQFAHEARCHQKLYNVLLYVNSLEPPELPPVPRFDGLDPLMRTWVEYPTGQIIAYYYGPTIRLDRFGQLALHASRAMNGLAQELPAWSRGHTDVSGIGGLSYLDLLNRFEAISNRRDVPFWLLVVHHLAWREIPGSPLVARRKIWDRRWPVVGHFTLPYELEQRQRELDGCPEALRACLGTKPQVDRFFSELPDDLFACSVHAIDLLLECGIREVKETIRPLVPTETSNRSDAERHEPSHEFRLQGKIWHLRYTEAGQQESGDFPKRVGLGYYAYLLKHPGDEFPATDLLRLADGSIPPVDSSKMEALTGTDSGAGVSVRSHWAKDVAVAGVQLRDLRSKLPGLRRELEIVKQERMIEREEELSNKIAQLEEYLASNTGLRGKPKEMKYGDPKESARKSVYNALANAKTKIAEDMPNLAKHLDQSVSCSNGCYGYRPRGSRPDWSL